MFRPRIIPVLLIKDDDLVKSTKFKKHRYIGDPINAVKLFNEFKADELIILDISATDQNRSINIEFVKEIAEEIVIPFGVGGGITTIDQIRDILYAGAEKVIIRTAALNDFDFIQKAVDVFGSSAISVCIDVKTKLFRKRKLKYVIDSKINLLEFIHKLEKLGVGELIIQSINRDGTNLGYDHELIKMISENVSISVVCLGGAKNLEDIKKAYNQSFANAMGVGSLFIYQGINKGVLLNYPTKKEIANLRLIR